MARLRLPEMPGIASQQTVDAGTNGGMKLDSILEFVHGRVNGLVQNQDIGRHRHKHVTQKTQRLIRIGHPDSSR